MVLFLTIALFVLCNLIRGRGWFLGGRIVACVGFGMSAWFCARLLHYPLASQNAVGLICAFGFYLWALFGWGKYFSAFTGLDNPLEYEVRFIDRLGYHFYPSYGSNTRINIQRGTFCMCLRGLFLYPTFLALAYFVHPMAAIVGLASGAQGFAYRALRLLPVSVVARTGVAYAEALWGACMGILVYFSLFL